MPTALADLQGQLVIFALAMIRPGAALLAAPVFGARSIPIQLRLILSLAIGVPAASAAGMTVPIGGMFSVDGILLILGEAVLGLAVGFALHIGFAAALVAGEVIGATMGLGFAAMQDPTSGHSSTAISQYLNMLATVLFIAANGHLALVQIIVESFRSLPPGASWISASALKGFIDFSGLMFAAGMAIALPVAFTLVLVQVAMGLLTRSAPALNLFAVGIPATILAGVVMLGIASPLMIPTLENTIAAAMTQARDLSTRH